MASLPPLMVIQVKGCGWVKHGDNNAVVVENGEGVFDPLSKIEVERSKSSPDGYVHLRFCQSKKYWARSDEGWVVANATKPQEDASKPSCTLFRYVAEGRILHVQSGGYVNMNHSQKRLYVVADPKVDTGFACFTILDGGKCTKLPKHVAFKGDNDKYLQVYGKDNQMQFIAGNPTFACGQQTFPQKDGSVRIKSDYNKKFWRLGDYNLIYADKDDDGTSPVETHFWPVPHNCNKISLRNESNHMFCARAESDYLQASDGTITKESTFEMTELPPVEELS